VSRAVEEVKAKDRLNRFLARADAVAECALARRSDLDDLGTKVTFDIADSGEILDVRVNLAPEEEVEQAIARMRPVLLKGDDIYWGRVVSAMKLLAFDYKAARHRIDVVARAWADFPPTYLKMESFNKNTGEGYFGSDGDLAQAWLYAEFIHSDAEKARKIAPTSKQMRRHATTLFAKDGVQYVTGTARMIREMAAQEVLGLQL
jgi:hypothetical protein